MKCRILKNGECEITQEFNSNHLATDVVGGNYTLDEVVAHSSGIVVMIQIGKTNDRNSTGNDTYGNFVKIKHPNGYYTLYAHLDKIYVKLNEEVNKGQIIGLMGNTGNSTAAHTHFEVRTPDNNRINSLDYLNMDLPNLKEEEYKIGDEVEINGVYISSSSKNKLIPAVKNGIITRIILNARNPYLLNDGKIGWVNKDCIIKKLDNENIKVGDMVRPIKAISYDNVKLANFVLNNTYPVIEVKGDRVVLGNGLNTAFNIKDVRKQ